MNCRACCLWAFLRSGVSGSVLQTNLNCSRPEEPRGNPHGLRGERGGEKASDILTCSRSAGPRRLLGVRHSCPGASPAAASAFLEGGGGTA